MILQISFYFMIILFLLCGVLKLYNEERNLINKDILKLRRQNHFKYAFLIEKESRDLKSLYNDQGVKIYKFVIVIAAFGLIQYVFTWVLFQYFINLT